jgi:hypothetical protein
MLDGELRAADEVISSLKSSGLKRVPKMELPFVDAVESTYGFKFGMPVPQQ